MICVVLCGSKKNTIYTHPKVGHWKFQEGRVSQKLKFDIMKLAWHLQGVVVCVFREEGGGVKAKYTLCGWWG